MPNQFLYLFKYTTFYKKSKVQARLSGGFLEPWNGEKGWLKKSKQSGIILIENARDSIEGVRLDRGSYGANPYHCVVFNPFIGVFCYQKSEQRQTEIKGVEET